MIQDQWSVGIGWESGLPPESRRLQRVGES